MYLFISIIIFLVRMIILFIYICMCNDVMVDLVLSETKSKITIRSLVLLQSMLWHYIKKKKIQLVYERKDMKCHPQSRLR